MNKKLNKKQLENLKKNKAQIIAFFLGVFAIKFVYKLLKNV